MIKKGFDISASFIQGGWLELDTSQDLILYERLEKAGVLETFSLTSFDPVGLSVSLSGSGKITTKFTPIIKKFRRGPLCFGPRIVISNHMFIVFSYKLKTTNQTQPITQPGSGRAKAKFIVFGEGKVLWLRNM